MAAMATGAVTEGNGAASPARLLFIASPKGRIKQLFEKVAQIQKKYGTFNGLVIVGDLLSPQGTKEGTEGDESVALLNGGIECPLPTYFHHPSTTLSEEWRSRISEKELSARRDDEPLELAKNLYWLGKSGMSRLHCGASIAFCGGCWNQVAWRRAAANVAHDEEADTFYPFVTPATIKRIMRDAAPAAPRKEPQSLAEAKAAAAESRKRQETGSKGGPRTPDILLLSYWPASISKNSKVDLPHPTATKWGCAPFANVLQACKPRYVFALGPSMGGLDFEGEATFAARIKGLDPVDEPISSSPEALQIRESGVWWEREPFMHGTANGQGIVTRFISLAIFANERKQKWFMALSISPQSSQASASSAAGLSKSPYAALESGQIAGKKRSIEDADGAEQASPDYRFQERPDKRQRGQPPRGYVCRVCGSEDHFVASCPFKADEERPPEGYVCKACGSSEHYIRLCPQKDRRREAVTAVAPQDCWFCLSNPQCAKHLIVSIGEECYLALPKGQLPKSGAGAGAVPGGGHALIIPIAHVPSLLALPPSTAQPMVDEIDAYRKTIHRVYDEYDNTAFSWEIGKLSHTRAGHMQVQILPVPRSRSDGLLAAFKEAARKESYDFKEGGDAEDLIRLGNSDSDNSVASRGAEYVRVDIGSTTLAMSLAGQRFSFQFPRTFIANYLGMPERADWKDCARSEKVEATETDIFKEAFNEFAEGL